MQEKAPGTDDRRVRRTRAALRDALLALIQEKGFDATTVQDVIDRADVGRSTFYAHFTDKEDLLTSGFTDLRQGLKAAVAAGEPRALGFTAGLAAHAFENRKIFRALVGRRSGKVVQRLFRGLVLELVQDDLARFAPHTPQPELAAQFLTGAFMDALAWWLDGRSGLDEAAFEAAFHALAGPVLESLARARPRRS